jgi:hypothetical protein
MTPIALFYTRPHIMGGMEWLIFAADMPTLLLRSPADSPDGNRRPGKRRNSAPVYTKAG